ncbi:MAG TPA: RNA polymerase sigma-70 factor [Thermoanaerobaculia bacterium]|nr:RNA polymerase sigma-70 factor [Thermoanaerobaculia bacterium]
MNDFETYRGLLFSIAYRMIGSAADAEDLVQDAYVRYASTDRDVVRDVKAFLVTILTRLALDRLKSAQVQREQYIGPWLPEPVFTGRDADPFASAARDEAIQVALLTAMERLSPQERAVLLLSEVLEYDHDEIAEMLDISTAASRQHLHRARERIAAEKQRFQPSADEKRRLIESFMGALQSGSVDMLRDVLTADVIARGDGGGKVAGAGMRPVLGFDKVARLYLSLAERVLPVQRLVMEEVNGSPALVLYTNERLDGIVTFDFDGDRIAEINSVLNPDKLAFARRQISASGR